MSGNFYIYPSCKLWFIFVPREAPNVVVTYTVQAEAPPDFILARWVLSEVKRPARDTETSFR
jgi:hypothetical protein